MVRPNLLDLLEILVFLFIVYRGQKSSLFNELFKLISVFLAVVIATHYYAQVGSFLGKMLGSITPWANVVAFVALATGFSLFFPVIKDGWVSLMNVDAFPSEESWIYGALAALRGYFIGGIIFFALVISNNPYFKDVAKQSLSKFIFKDICVDTYRLAYYGFIKPVFSIEAFNMSALDAVGKNFESSE